MVFAGAAALIEAGREGDGEGGEQWSGMGDGPSACTCVCVPVTCAQLRVHLCPHRASVCLLASGWCRHPASLCPGVDAGVVCVDTCEHLHACGGPSDLVFCAGSLAVLKRSPRATGGEGQQGPSGSQSGVSSVLG